MSVDGKRQQHVARQSAPGAITRTDVEHAARDGRAWTVHGTALGRDTVYRDEVASGIVVPDYLAVARGIAAQTAIHGPGKHHTRDRRDRSRLCWAAKRPIAARGRGGGPHLFAGCG